MRTVYIVFFEGRLLFAFATAESAQHYIEQACALAVKHGQKPYSVEKLYYRSCDVFPGEALI